MALAWQLFVYIYVYLLWRRAAKRAWWEGFVIQANAVQVILLGGKGL